MNRLIKNTKHGILRFTLYAIRYTINITRYKLHATRSRGFTLIEVLIASVIFVFVIGIATLTFTSASNIQSRTKVLRDTSQTLAYATESIARDVRLASAHTNNGVNYAPFSILSDGNNTMADITIDYVDPEDRTREDPFYISREYKVVDNQYAGVHTLVAIRNVYANGNLVADAPEALTPSYIDVQKLVFTYIDNWATSSIQQPYLTMEMTIKNTQGKKVLEQSTQSLRTSITTREYPGFE